MTNPKKKNKRQENINLLIHELQKAAPAGGLTLKEMAEICGVSTRNIYRYLNDIEKMGIEIIRPVQIKPALSGRGRYRLKYSINQEFSEDAEVIIFISYCIVGAYEYRRLLCQTLELLIKHLALKNRLSLPFGWALRC